MTNKAISASFVCLALLSACSPQLILTAGPVPEDTAAVRAVSSFGGSELAELVPLRAWYRANEGDRKTAIVPVGAPADMEPRVVLEALDGSGCVLARGAARHPDYWGVALEPVQDCGRIRQEQPGQPAQPQPEPGPPTDTDGDGVPDASDFCPLEDNRERALYEGKSWIGSVYPDPARPGCPAPDSDGDGYPDPVDACPDRPRGPYPGLRPGCPDTLCDTPKPVVLPLPPGGSATPAILDATPLRIPAGERRKIVVRVTGVDVDVSSISRIDNYTGGRVQITGRKALSRNHYEIDVWTAREGWTGLTRGFELWLVTPAARLRLEGLEVVPAPTSCN